MLVYWLDADVYIQAKNGPYPFEMVPGFWVFLAEHLELGNIKSPKLVYDELTDGNDLLAQWCKHRRNVGIRTNASKEVQDCYRKISNHVHTKYKPQDALLFLKGGDGWVIAHAMATGGIVVAQESVSTKKKKVKVPTVCREFGVKCINTYEMLARLGFRIH